MTIQSDYRRDFGNKEWETIKLFELHFQKAFPKCDTLRHLELRSRKWEFWLSLQSIRKSNFGSLCASTIQAEKRRQKAGNLVHGINLFGRKTHIPSVLADSIKEVVSADIDILTSVACVDCVKSYCGDTKGVHVFVQLPENHDISHEDALNLCTSVKLHVGSVHGEFCHGVCLLRNGTFKQFVPKGADLQVYQLRDSVFSRKTFFHFIIRLQQKRHCSGSESYPFVSLWCFVCELYEHGQ